MIGMLASAVWERRLGLGRIRSTFVVLEVRS